MIQLTQTQWVTHDNSCAGDCVETCDNDKAISVGNNILPLCIKVSCQISNEIFLLRSNGYKLNALLTFSCVKGK